MIILLSNLKRGRIKKRKRVGRGDASGHGTYSTRGSKGQRSRSGGKKGLIKMSLKRGFREVPKKRGFRSLNLRKAAVNVGDLDKSFAEGEEVNYAKLIGQRLAQYSPRGLKILGQGELKKKLFVKAHFYSKQAEEKIEKAGGRAEVIKISR